MNAIDEIWAELKAEEQAELQVAIKNLNKALSDYEHVVKGVNKKYSLNCKFIKHLYQEYGKFMNHKNLLWKH